MYEVYGKANCPACTEAKLLLDSAGEAYIYKQLGKDFSLGEMFEIAPATHKTFPMIAEDGKYLGTLVDLKAKLQA